MAKFGRAEIRKILGDVCTDEMENSLVALHLGVVDPMKDEIEKAKASAAKFEEVQKELDGLKKQAEEGNNWKVKYEKEHSDFDEYKKQIEQDKAVGNVKTAYRALLKETNLDDKLIDTIIAGTDFSNMKLDKDGKLEGADKMSESIKTEWKDYIPVTKVKGGDVSTPPKNTGTKMTLEQIDAIEDTAERQRAMLENAELFGI